MGGDAGLPVVGQYGYVLGGTMVSWEACLGARYETAGRSDIC